MATTDAPGQLPRGTGLPVPGDPGLANSLNSTLNQLRSGVLTNLPNNQVELLQRILLTETAILIAFMQGYNINEEPQAMLDLAADVIGQTVT